MFASVITLRPLTKNFFYKIEPNQVKYISEGIRVLVPLGNSQEVAFVTEITPTLPIEIQNNIEIKTITEILDKEPIVDQNSFKLFKWLSDYYFYPMGEIIKRALPAQFSQKKPVNLNKFIQKPKTFELYPKNLEVNVVTTLNILQKNIISQITSSKTENSSPFLLNGITGSGKTEIYIECIKHFIKNGTGALVLVPEISLTPQLIARFAAHFGQHLALFHSSLTPSQRLSEWAKVKFQKVSIAIGVRSAIFLPFKKLGIIIIDEEHENTFKQDDRFKYNARDIAVLRGKQEGACVILGSATPSIESFYKCQNKLYTLLSLQVRACQKTPALVEVIDLRKKNVLYKNSIFSKELFEAMEENMLNDRQTLLFLNRTGYSNIITCLDCGKNITCPNCSIPLIYYKSTGTFDCGYCEFNIKKTNICSHCKGSNLVFIGIGTERIEEDLTKYLPSAKFSRMDRTSTKVRGSREKIIESLSNKKIDILIGTQMIAKGFDFHNITLVGIINADTVLGIPDYKSPEKTFQLVAQVSGRAGRGSLSGKVFIQTYNPDHYAIQHAKTEDYLAFYNQEVDYRKEFNYPPFSRLLCLKISGNNEQDVKNISYEISTVLNKYIARNDSFKNNFILLGPTKQLIYKLKNKYRYQLLLKSKSPSQTNVLIKTFIKNHSKLVRPSGIKISFDIDPMNLT